MNQRHQQHYKTAGLVLLAVPIVVLLIFMVGEMLAGERGGAVHLLQILPLALLLIAGWEQPRLIGWMLVIGGAVLGIAYPILAERQPLIASLVTELLLFLPPVAAGALLLASQSKHSVWHSS